MTQPTTPAAGPTPPLDAPAMPPRSSWFGVVKGLLWFSGICYVLIGAVAGPAMGWAMTVDGEVPVFVGWLIGIGTFLFCAAFGGANFAAAIGLDRETKWGWIVSLVLAAMYAPSGCLPIGVLMLVGLLQDGVRKPCMDS
jgi:hypothetical protein